MRDAIIIGGGPSVADYDVNDLREHGFVIGVNESCVLAQCHVGLSMDRLWAEHRARDFFLMHPNNELWVREGAAKNLGNHPRLRRFECDHKSWLLSDEAAVFNGTNSGLCALNYAYQKRPARIFLFGYDMQRGPKGEPYWYPPYPWANPEGGTKPAKFDTWASQFKDVAIQLAQRRIEVYNVSPRSTIKVFPKVTFKQFLEMTS